MAMRDRGRCGYGGGLWRKQFLLDLEKRVKLGVAKDTLF
jgi:hypothetical protein